MQKIPFRVITIFIILFLMSGLFAPVASANSAEPPAFTIIVRFPPNDLSLSIRFADGTTTEAVRLSKTRKAWEAYYRFFYWMAKIDGHTLPSFEGASLIVETQNNHFECLLPHSAIGRYNSVLTLDIANETIIMGKSPTRSIILVSMRVGFTLIIEGAVFYLFGYRKKRSWIAFVIINILTQSALNMAFSGPNQVYLWPIGFFSCEVLVFIVETISFPLILKEFSKGKAVKFALLANITSLILGGVMISCLPV